MEKEIITSVAIGIGLAASCGFRVFVAMLATTVIIILTFFIIKKFRKNLILRKLD